MFFVIHVILFMFTYAFQTQNETNTCDFDFECETLCCEFNEDYSQSKLFNNYIFVNLEVFLNFKLHT